MDGELLPAENAWMQGTAGAYVGRKRASLIFGLLVSYWPLARGLTFLFVAVLAAQGGCKTTEIVEVALS
jgi:hypothetical protein